MKVLPTPLTVKTPRKIPTMKVLPVPFAVATYSGVWEPVEWSHIKWKRNLYRLFTAFVLFVMCTFLASQLVEVIVHFLKHKGISPTLYYLLSLTSACYKTVAFLMKKQDVVFLSKILLSDHCVAKDANEKAIQKQYDKVNRFVTEISLLLVFGDVLLIAMAPLLNKSHKLPHKTWLPYSIEDPWNYWLSYIHQVLGLIFCGFLTPSIDIIVTGFVWQACAQFDILEHRFKTLPGLVLSIRSQKKPSEANDMERVMLRRCLQHHNHNYLFVEKVIKTFSSIIFVQFCVSALGITVSVYQLSMTSPKNVDFAKVFLYLIIMLIEFLVYCWFGNEVQLKSIQFAENVYKSEWMILNLQSWKMILFLIHRSSKPIVISCYNMVVLSLDTYVQILKLSYSVFNLLRNLN